MEYQVLITTEVSELEHLVNEHCADGWIPCGGVAVSNWRVQCEGDGDYTNTEYAQAMVRETK